MSDLSLPPLSLLPLDEAAPAQKPAAAPSGPMLWPTPPFARYPAPTAPLLAEACEVEGSNGKVHQGRLSLMDLAGSAVHLQVPPARGTLTLKFGQFRRLTLTTPLRPQAGHPGDAAVAPRAPQRCHIVWADGGETEIESIGLIEQPAGWFVFPPQGGDGSVLRSFVPRGSAQRVEIGPLLGQILVEQKAATPEQIDAALAEQRALRSRKLGEMLVDQQIVTPEQLHAAIEQQSKMPMVRIGEALVALGLIDELRLASALAQQQMDRSVPLGELLVRRGDITREDLQTALARKMGYPVVDAANFQAEAEAVARVPLAVARRLPALPLMLRRGRVVVALEDPSSRSAIDELEFTAQGKVVPVLARAGTLAQAVERVYAKHGHETWQGNGELGVMLPPDFEGETAGKLLQSLEQNAGSEGASGEDLPIEQSDNQLVRLINSMIQEAQATGVSDIHIECTPGREKVRIRFRKDGVLRPYLELPPSHRQALVARLKIMCDLDISERRKPQDGKIAFSRFVSGSNLELRVATIPTTGGCEDVVMRLLASARTIPLAQMGLAPSVLERFQAVIGRPYGMVLCVGPTGSGKTTTLHAALGAINTPDRKIWTAEDPVEITQPGLRQVQVNPKIDFTFAKALRAFLRADPDVVMIGEIRDKETAQMAIEASLTGHMVMSTLHTNSAPETVTRLLDMGMDPFNFADSLLAVLAQRLARRLCKHCKTEEPASEAQIEEWIADWRHGFPDRALAPEVEVVRRDWEQRFGVEGRLMYRHAPGCPQCGNSGFAGRVGLHELMTVNRDLRHLIQTGARADEIQRCAMADGMRTLRQDGIEKMLAGQTTIEEVRSSSNA